MKKVLYIQASPRGEDSFSIAAANAFIDAYRKIHPDDEIVTNNLFDMSLPAYDENVLGAKYAAMQGKPPLEEHRKAWQAVEETIEAFKSADKYVFAVPMWNFSIPYRLKHYMDIIIQPGRTYAYTPEDGTTGLVPDRPVFIVYARGGLYPRGSEMEHLDFQIPFFKTLLNFIGLRNIETVTIDATLGSAQSAEANLDNAIRKAKDIAEMF
jgi:FMN-dependent NADH-azoreductase